MSRSTQNKTEPPKTITDTSTVLQFGKYKGKTIAFVMEHNPDYLLFCQEKIDFFDLDHKIISEIEETDNRYTEGNI